MQEIWLRTSQSGKAQARASSNYASSSKRRCKRNGIAFRCKKTRLFLREFYTTLRALSRRLIGKGSPVMRPASSTVLLLEILLIRARIVIFTELPLHTFSLQFQQIRVSPPPTPFLPFLSIYLCIYPFSNPHPPLLFPLAVTFIRRIYDAANNFRTSSKKVSTPPPPPCDARGRAETAGKVSE